MASQSDRIDESLHDGTHRYMLLVCIEDTHISNNAASQVASQYLGCHQIDNGVFNIWREDIER